MDRIVSVHVAVVAGKNIVRQAPGLGLIIADILHLQPYLFHHFPADALLKSLPDLREARDQCRDLLHTAVPGIIRKKQFVPVGDADDHGGIDSGIDHSSAVLAAHGPLYGVRFRPAAAAAAETVCTVPACEMYPGKGRKDLELLKAVLIADLPYVPVFKPVRYIHLVVQRNEITEAVDGKRIDHLHFRPQHRIYRPRISLFLCADENVPSAEMKDRVPCLRPDLRMIFVMKFFRCDILDHGFPLSCSLI